jgi:PAS domain S-box-containing protein
LFEELRLHQIELEMQNEELRLTARELEKSRAQYRSLYEGAPVGYLGLRADGIIERSNPAARALLSHNGGDLVGKQFAAFVEMHDVHKLNSHLQNVKETGNGTCELLLGPWDRMGPFVRLETSARRGGAAGYRMVLTDITARQRAEQALRKLNNELEERIAERTVELAQRNDELEAQIAGRIEAEKERLRLEGRLREAERLEGLGLLAGGIAHDFNNILVGVISNAEMMLEYERIPEQVREGLVLIRDAGLSAADLTRQLLVYAGLGRVVLVTLDLEAAVTRALNLLRGRVPPGIEVRSQFASGLPCINADAGQVQQVITNLVMNSVEAMKDRPGTISVHASREKLTAERLALYSHKNDIAPGEFVVLRVDDNGPGIEAATLARMFDPFFTTKFAGRGLGLASVLGIVRGHRAGLCVQSRPGEGTTFEIAWPIASAPAAARPSHPEATWASWTGSGRALVVDDNAGVRATVARLLRQIGFDVTEASDSNECIALVRSAPGFALAVVDRTMPDRSGEETIAALREVAPDLPVVLMSGYLGKKSMVANEQVTFLQKPMTIDQLRDAVRRLIERPRGDLP